MQLEAISHREFEVVVKDGLRSPVNTTYGAHLEERPWGVAPVEKKASSGELVGNLEPGWCLNLRQAADTSSVQWLCRLAGEWFFS